MEANNIITAPQIADVDTVYRIWYATHAGNRNTFYRFMTTPTVERDEFIRSIGESVEFDESLLATIITV